ncbi:MAG: hypothetical protein HKL84_07725 [Acidimicrobiaceae bacterium]|nr:hypothetical protein [Acidimicrobiaceae bacterium]
MAVVVSGIASLVQVKNVMGLGTRDHWPPVVSESPTTTLALIPGWGLNAPRSSHLEPRFTGFVILSVDERKHHAC